jgi:hypothetical protein
LLGTINLSQNINLSVGTNCIAILTSDGFSVGDILNLSAGMAISTDITKWSVRPEFVYNFWPGSDQHFISLNAGLHFSF